MYFGIAAGVAALAITGLLISKKKKSKKNKYSAEVEEARENFKSKLSELQRKAKKEYKYSNSETQSAVNSAIERAADWINKTSN